MTAYRACAGCDAPCGCPLTALRTCHVVVSTAHVAAACACGWNSDAVAEHAAKLAESEAHMHQRYSVFVQSTEDDGTTVMCWGMP